MAYTNIDDPSAHFQTATYTGNGSSQSITNDGNSDMQPDWVWVKSRSITYHNVVFDSSRGVNNRLVTNLSQAEDTGAGYGTVSAFNSDGFSVSSGANTNNNSATYVGWQWKANGGTTSTNNDGNHTSVVQANQDAGFSIVTYTGTGNTSSTVGHGLGVTPNWIIFKRRSGTGNWDVQIDGTSRATLNLTEASATNVLSSFSSTTFGLGSVTSNEKNANGSTYVAYCFAEKQGYSKFGKYTGAGSSSPFVYTGFKPAFLLIRRIDAANSWGIVDNKRGYNGGTETLFADLTNAESSTYTLDLLSNGFRPASNHSIFNQSSGSYIYMAFAESPFVTSTGIPTTAR
jgi:hypothetical protein